MQWRYAGPDRYGETKPDGDIMVEMMLAIRKLYKEQGGVFPEPILGLGIDKWMEGHEFSPANTAKVMNGYFLRDVTIGGKLYKAGHQVPAFAMLQADGSTASGNWLHAGSWTDEGNMMARRDKTQTPEQEKIGLFPNWSYAWPMNRRIIYNRASVDKQGRPWNPDKPVIQWRDGKWVGDVVDGGGDPGTKYPFIMQKDGQGALFGPGREDGPLRVLRTDGIALREARLLRAAQQPRGVQGHRRSAGRGGRAFPVHRHDLPRHRALADGPHDPPLLVAGGSRAAGLRGA